MFNFFAKKQAVMIAFCVFSQLLLSSFGAFSNTAKTGMRDDITAVELTAEMAPGANLWNTLDAVCDYQSGLDTELCWGNPFTTLKMITDIKEQGFKTLRIPVSWHNHMGAAPDYTIDQAWMDRVEEVANYAFENDMYVILNIHHDDLHEGRDGSWLMTTYEHQENCEEIIAKVWTQIATRFKEYGDYLIFETMNEPRPVGTSDEWSGGTAEHRDVVNQLNVVAVDAIRATGGNNASRFIMAPQVAANGGTALADWKAPNDDEKVIVSIHNYNPFFFTLADPGVKEWGSKSEIAALQNEIKAYYDTFVSKGRAVVIGEWGAGDKDNLGARVKYYEVYAQACKQYQIAPIAWIYSYNRNTETWAQPELEDAIFGVYNAVEGAPEVSFSNVEYGSSFTAGDDLSVEAEAADADGSVASVSLYLNDELVETITSAPYQWNNDGQHEALTNLTEGKHLLKVVAVDNEGKEFSKIMTFKVITPLTVPAKIEAENYTTQSGIKTESTKDVGGGENIGWIEDKDWTSYFVTVEQTGYYEVTMRSASDGAGGTVTIEADGTDVGSVEIEDAKTDGWQDWYTTEPVSISLATGEQSIKLKYKGAFNINWVEFQYIGENPPTAINGSESINSFFCYTQAHTSEVNIQYTIAKESVVDIAIVDINGTVVKQLVHSHMKSRGSYVDVWDLSDRDSKALPSGLYFVQFKTDKGVQVQKMAIK